MILLLLHVIILLCSSAVPRVRKKYMVCVCDCARLLTGCKVGRVTAP